MNRLALRIVPLAFLLVACKAKPDDAPPPATAATKAPAKAAPASQPSSRPAESRAASAKARLESSPAGKLVLRAIDRHGGLEAWYAQDAFGFVYAYRPVGDRPARVSMQFIDLETSRAYHQMTEPFQGRFAWDGEKAWMKLEGEGADEFGARFWALTPYYFAGMPFVLGDPGVNLAIVSDDPKAAGFDVPADVVKATFAPGTGDAPDDYYVLYLAKDDGRLLGVRYIVTYFGGAAAAKEPKEKLVVYEMEGPAGALKIPRKHTFYAFTDGKRGEVVTNAVVEAVAMGAKFDESKLEMPEGAILDTSKK